MIKKRCFHATVTIDEHRILVLGGARSIPGVNYVGTVEEFDIQTNAWSRSRPKMPYARAHMAAVTSEEGEVHVIGGADVLARQRADKLRLATNVWTRNWCDLPSDRFCHAAARVGDKIVVVGGMFDSWQLIACHTSPILLDLTTRKWKKLPEPSSAERVHCAAVGIGETVYVIGGHDRFSNDLDSMEAFNIQTNTWTKLPSMSIPRSGHAAVAVGQRIVVVGGKDMNSVEMYDIDTSQWSPLPPMSVPRWGAALAAPGGDRVIVTGGLRGPTYNESFDSVEQLMLPPQRVGQGDEEEPKSSKFFVMLMEPDTLSMHLKLAALAPLIEEVHQMKIYYTLVATCCRLGLIEQFDAAQLIEKGLTTSYKTCINHEITPIYQLILKKAQDDKYVTDQKFYELNNRAMEEVIMHSDRIQNIVQAIRANTANIKGLEANLAAVTNAVNSIKKGLQCKQRKQAVLGFTSMVLNVLCMGVGESLLACLDSIVDFGDISHLETIIEAAQDSEFLQYLNEGIDIANDPNEALESALGDGNHPLVILCASAVLVQDFQDVQEAFQIEVDAKAPAQATSQAPTQATAQATSQATSQATAMFNDAMLSVAEEAVLPLHAAVKYSDRELLEERIQQVQANINVVDSQGRTAMDMAALTGQIELMNLIKNNGGECKLQDLIRMRAIARARADYAENYRAQIQASLWENQCD